MEYKLKTPVQKVTGEQVETVTIKESFTGRDIRAIGNCKGEGDSLIALVSAATGLSENTVLGMDSRDVVAVGQLAAPFFNLGKA